MKVLKLIGGYLALGWFFLFVDQSGIGFDKNVKAVLLMRYFHCILQGKDRHV